MKPMTPEEFAEAMKNLQNHEIEERHVIADELLCSLLVSLGYQDGVVIFLNMGKLYG